MSNYSVTRTILLGLVPSRTMLTSKAPNLRPTYDTVHLNGSIGENNGGPVEARLRYAYSLWQTHSINTGAWPAMCRRYATSNCIKITLALKFTLSLLKLIA